MKKRLLSLALALALCLGLAVPALAADVSGLDAKGAQAFYDALSAYGSVNKLYADLLDMDGDKVPELVVVTGSQDALIDSWDGFSNYEEVELDIWKIKDGKAVKNVNLLCYPTPGDNFGGLGYAVSNGKIYVYYSLFSMYGDFPSGVYTVTLSGEDKFISANGVEEYFFYEGEIENPRNDDPKSEGTNFYQVVDGKTVPMTKAEYDQRMSKYQGFNYNDLDSMYNRFLSSDARMWHVDPDAFNTCQTVLNQLRTKANEAPSKPTTSTPAPGTFGPYTIRDGEGAWAWSVSFDAAKVEKATVQYRMKWVVGSEEAAGPYQSMDVTLVTLKPESGIFIIGNSENGINGVQRNLVHDGTRKYTYINYSNMLYGDDFNMAWLSYSVEHMKGELKTGPLMLTTGDYNNEKHYIVAYELASAPATPSFTDVPAGEYYAAPVSWAVSKNITNGTSATAFSPDQTCTQAQILTFLYRAVRNGGTADASDMDKAVSWAREKGMIGGGFDGGKPCTRASAVKFIWQAMGSPRPSVTSIFRDVSSTASYASAVSWAVDTGVTNGTSATTFSPNDTCTRGQIVTFLYRAMG